MLYGRHCPLSSDMSLLERKKQTKIDSISIHVFNTLFN